MQKRFFLAIGLTVILTFPGGSGWAFNNSPVQGLHQEILSEMETEEPRILPPVEILWRHTLQRNPTLQLALQKLAEKTGRIKPHEKSAWTQRMLQGLIQIGGMGGAVVTGSPAPLVGSTVLGRIANPGTLPGNLTAVTSADLVILAREIEEAQSQLIVNYVRYRQAQQEKAQLETSLATLENQLKSVTQDTAFIADTLQARRMHQSLEIRQAQNTVDTYRNLLILSAGEAAMREVDQLRSSEDNSQQNIQAPIHDTGKPIETPQG